MEKELINSPKHYNNHPSNIECIELIRHMNFNIGNAIKYIFRRDDKEDSFRDLKKALWYINDEIIKREKKNYNTFLCKIALVFERFIRPDVYDQYETDSINFMIVNEYEPKLSVREIYYNLNIANYFFYDTVSLKTAKSYLEFLINMEALGIS